jgi:bla regulator protein blaR1
MITFVIKSAICLTILYGFYHFFLRNTKAFTFNRFYLLLSSIYAIVISIISIRVGIRLPFNFNNLWYLNFSDKNLPGEQLTTGPIHSFIIPDILIIIYITVSMILLFRFTMNIYKIIHLMRTSMKVIVSNIQLVLVDKTTLPFSFFGYVFVNRSEYENGNIEKEIFIHERVHCLQYHSVDILLIETIKIILWFNPFIWLFDKAIQLNHEYLADNKVLTKYKLIDYQKTLVNLVFRNNSTYLASHLNYSLTKKRLIMMKKQKSRAEILSILAAIPMFLFLGLAIANAQESSSQKVRKEKQADTLSIPVQDNKMKVQKADPSEKAVTYPKHPVGTGALIPPPPPPPPPPPSNEMKVKKGDRATDTKQVKNADGSIPPLTSDNNNNNNNVKNADGSIPPPPPPPPPPPVKKN